MEVTKWLVFYFPRARRWSGVKIDLTGFRWSEDAQISDSSVLQQEIHEFHGPESELPPPPGTPGLESWRFKTLNPGTSIIYVEYGRPWEGGEKGEWTYTLEVVVK